MEAQQAGHSQAKSKRESLVNNLKLGTGSQTGRAKNTQNNTVQKKKKIAIKIIMWLKVWKTSLTDHKVLQIDRNAQICDFTQRKTLSFPLVKMSS